MKHHTDILILGVGIAGYEAYRSLAKKMKLSNKEKKITLVDKNDYFTFVPLLHEVATGSVLAKHSSFPIQEIIHGTQHEFVQATVSQIDPEKKSVTTSAGTISYETCIIALGSINNTFDIPGVLEYTYQIRTLKQATLLHQNIIRKIQETKSSKIHINIIGGGYTGVELAAEFAELAKTELQKLFPEKTITINLIQALDTIVPHLPQKARNIIENRLKKIGVTIIVNNPAKEIKKDCITLADGTIFSNDITVWTAGFTTEAPQFLDKKYIEKNRICVDKHLRIPHHPRTYVIGDMAYIRDPDNDDIIYPQLGEAAHHAGMYIAKHYFADKSNTPCTHFHFKSKGQLMPVGEWYGIGIFGNCVYSGRFMWWLRRTVYVLFMPGIIRKIKIVLNWTFHRSRHLVK